MELVRKYRRSRAWNINGNIVLATAGSALLTAAVIHVLEPRLVTTLDVLVATATVDFLFDMAIYAALHLWANATHFIVFMKDVTRIQWHRVVLGPLFYLVAVGGQAALLAAGLRPSWTVLVAYVAALALTRWLHTWYGFRVGLFRKAS